jgi:hypothetical protein
MSTLLANRYKIKGLTLSRDNNLRFVIALSGKKNSISFPSTPESFWQNDINCPLAYWNANSSDLNLPFDNNIPLPGYNKIEDLFKIKNGNYVFFADLIGIIYWILCRIEEVDSDSLDKHGRFKFESSHAYKNSYLMRPIVDEYFFILGKIIDELWPKNERIQDHFKFCVSHDVDAPEKYPHSSYFLIFRRFTINLVRGNLNECKTIIKVLLSNKDKLSEHDAYNQFDWIMTKSEQFNLKSTFYFICDKTSMRYDGDYRLKDESIKNLIRSIHSRGHNLGVHFSYNSYKSIKSLKKEIKKFKELLLDEKIYQKEIGSRMHYLRWTFPGTLRGLKEVGIEYDATMTYAGHVGFRAGTCFSYIAFDPSTGKNLGLEIRPLIAMENSVLTEGYMNVKKDDNPEEIFYKLIESCKKVGGTFSLLWHNSDLEFPYERSLYCKILEYASKKNISLKGR